jgi:hypothetical protein
MRCIVLIIFFLLAAMAALAPGRDHAVNATAIANVILAEPPLFKDDESKLRTAAFVTAVAFRESSLRNDAIGDHGHALCMFQLWAAPRTVLTDPELCARIAMQRLRESMLACGAGNELGIYAAGPKGCSSAHAKRISADRMHMAHRLAKVAP